MKYLFLIILGISCSSHKKNVLEYEKLKVEISPKLNSCSEYVERILTKAVVNDKSGPHFIKDEKAALTYIKLFDPQKLAIDENRRYAEFIMTRCLDDKNVEDKIPACVYQFSTYQFIKQLTKAVATYKWSNSTKALGKEKILSYLSTIARTETSVIDKAMAISILKVMRENGLVAYSFTESIVGLNLEAESVHEGLAKALKGKNECKDWSKAYHREIEASQKLGVKLNNLIKDMPLSP